MHQKFSSDAVGKNQYESGKAHGVNCVSFFAAFLFSLGSDYCGSHSVLWLMQLLQSANFKASGRALLQFRRLGARG
jgi:hypothetical protein